jgi:5'(3')-deoxyribonucleotidase
MPCVALAAELADVPVSMVTKWDLTDTEVPPEKIAVMKKLWSSEVFVKCQSPYPGAQEFVQTLVDDGFIVMVASSVPPDVMTARGLSIRRYFPAIKPDHIVLGNMKKLLSVDVLIDDNPKNLGGVAKHSILVNRSHNQFDEVPYPRIDTYQEALNLILDYCPS